MAFAKESASPSSARYRVIEIALDIVRFMPADPGGMFVVSVWSGWLITIAFAEIWIRYSRSSRTQFEIKRG